MCWMRYLRGNRARASVPCYRRKIFWSTGVKPRRFFNFYAGAGRRELTHSYTCFSTSYGFEEGDYVICLIFDFRRRGAPPQRLTVLCSTEWRAYDFFLKKGPDFSVTLPRSYAPYIFSPNMKILTWSRIILCDLVQTWVCDIFRITRAVRLTGDMYC